MQVLTVPGTQDPDETSPQQQHKGQPAVVCDAPNLISRKQYIRTGTIPVRKILIVKLFGIYEHDETKVPKTSL